MAEIELSSLSGSPLVYENGYYRPASNSEYLEYKKEYAELEAKLNDVQDKQGVCGSIWNDVKEVTGLGTSQSKCETMLEKFKNGEINFEEAAEYIEKFDKKQDNMLDLTSNILTGVAAIAATTIAGVMGGPLLPIIGIGAGVGAVVKAGLKFFDRATNNVVNDEYDAKLIAKDIVTGAVTGATSAVPSGVSAGIKQGSKALAIENGAKCGIACGASSGAISYMTDVALGDTDFNFGELTKNTVTSAFVSGTVGAGVGAGLYGIADIQGMTGKTVVAKSMGQTIAQDGTSSSARKVLARVEKDAIAA